MKAEMRTPRTAVGRTRRVATKMASGVMSDCSRVEERGVSNPGRRARWETVAAVAAPNGRRDRRYTLAATASPISAVEPCTTRGSAQALRTRAAAAFSPRNSNIMAAERMAATGLARPVPTMSGADP